MEHESISKLERCLGLLNLLNVTDRCLTVDEMVHFAIYTQRSMNTLTRSILLSFLGFMVFKNLWFSLRNQTGARKMA